MTFIQQVDFLISNVRYNQRLYGIVQTGLSKQYVWSTYVLIIWSDHSLKKSESDQVTHQKVFLFVCVHLVFLYCCYSSYVSVIIYQMACLSTCHTSLHSGQKGIFDYFQFCFLVARSMHLNIIRYMRSKKVEIVEFQGRKMNF